MTVSWWQTGVIYQIYPRSFLDSNGDGVGDLPGIISKLDYLRWLGVDALWLSPIYPSPMADFGYDISDYTAVHPLFGTLQDLDTLLEQAHQRDLKLILDFVPTIPLMSIPGLWNRDPAARTRSAIGISGATPPPMAVRLITGPAGLMGRLGSSMNAAGSTTCTSMM